MRPIMPKMEDQFKYFNAKESKDDIEVNSFISPRQKRKIRNNQGWFRGFADANGAEDVTKDEEKIG